MARTVLRASLAGVGETAIGVFRHRSAPWRRRARPARPASGGEVSVDETIACRLPMNTRSPRSRPSARSSFSSLPSRCATLSAALSTSTASAASAPALRARRSDRRAATWRASAPPPQLDGGAAALLRCDLRCRPGLRLCRLCRRPLLARRRLLRGGRFFRGAAFEVGRARLRVAVFRLAGFLLGGIAGSLAGGADR